MRYDDIITKTEQNCMFNTLKNSKSYTGLLDYALFRFGLTSGLRAAELCGLTWGMISEGEERITCTFIGKGSKRRTVQVEPEALSACKRAFRARWGRAPKPSDYVFNGAATGRARGRPGITKSCVHLHVKAIIANGKALGIIREGLSFSTNTMRHSFAMLSANDGINPKTLSNILGITIGEVAEKYYTGEKRKELLKISDCEYREKNKERIKKYDKKYHAQKPEKRRTINRKRYNNNIQYNLRMRISNRIYLSLKRHGIKKTDKTIDLLGCNYYAFINHIESLFLPEMSWDNRNLWHIDHIIPCASFDLTDKEEQKKCFHYTNLQPLWAEDNLRKGAKLDWCKGGN